MPKSISPLTEKKIAAARPTEKEYKLFDGAGLYLLVRPTGSKWWRFKYRFEGKEKTLSFGVYPKVGLEDARANRDAARALIRDGVDPGPLRKEDKIREKAERLPEEQLPSVRVTMDGVIELWKGNKVMRLTTNQAQFIARLFDNITR